jgi:hypothetical protein
MALYFSSTLQATILESTKATVLCRITTRLRTRPLRNHLHSHSILLMSPQNSPFYFKSISHDSGLV